MTYGLLPEDIEALARKVVEENAQAGRTVALAESCTGGLVAAALTEVPGSSSVFDRSFVTYSNAAKREMLGVPSEIIETFGAVSIACVWAMAKGALERSGADVAVAISGVAGPSGGTTLKPVGTVVSARVTRNSENTPDGELKLFDGPDRAAIRKEAALWALELLLPKQREDAGASAD